MIGATNSYSQKRKSVEGIRSYRNNYKKRLMQAKRSDDNQIELAFENWTQLAKTKIKAFNNNEVSEDKLLHWAKEIDKSPYGSYLTIYFIIISLH